MVSVSSSSHRTSHATPRERVLTANIYISTLQLITALLLTLMLLWHISTVTLIENYRMPPWWVKLFVAELPTGWRVAVWAVVMILVPLDSLHALLCLDWWCFHLHDRRGNEQDEDIDNRSRKTHDCRIHASTISQLSSRTASSSTSEVASPPSGQPRTYHPLRRPLLRSPVQNILQSVLDITMVAVLAAHTASYFLSLPRYLAHCRGPAVESAPEVEFGEANVPLSVRDRCIRLNVDIHIAGGFAVFMAIVLGLLHIAGLAVRAWKRVELGKDGVSSNTSVESGSAEKHERESNAASSELEAAGSVMRSNSTVCSRPHAEISREYSFTTSLATPRDSASFSAEERNTGI